MERLVQKLRERGVLKTPDIIRAFQTIDRRNFVPAAAAAHAYEDIPLPIGSGQTISQPYTVAFMLELLQAQRGDRILDIGTGSGWQATLLGTIVGQQGEVWSVEVVPELVLFAQNNLAKYKLPNVHILERDGSEGLVEHAPFQRIIAAAASPEVPQALLEQLATGGRLVIPIGLPHDCTMHVYDKQTDGTFRTEKHPGFSFVPFVRQT